jgi:hypothetical protein
VCRKTSYSRFCGYRRRCLATNGYEKHVARGEVYGRNEE